MDPAGGAYDASLEPLVSWGWGHTLPIPPNVALASGARRLRCLAPLRIQIPCYATARYAPLLKILGRH